MLAKLLVKVSLGLTLFLQLFFFELLSNSFFLVLHPYRKFKILFQVLDLGKHLAPLATTFCIPLVRTNYGKFNIRFKGAVLWINCEGSLKP